MTRAIAVFLVSCIALGSCTQRLICPAYQSAFIYDKEALRQKFSYFQNDTTPKVFTASKTKYLIATPVSYQKKIRSMETVEMKPVYPVVPDSLRDDYVVSLAELDSAARTIIDSTYIVDVPQKNDSLANAEDSVYVITKDKEVRLLKYDMDSMKYSVVDVRLNVDQDNYMWYLRANLVLPDVKLAKQQGAGEKAAAKAKAKKKGFFGFFKNLFKKKHKEKADTTTLVPVKGEHDFDYVDTTQTKSVVNQESVKKKKKGFFSRNKKKEVAPDDNAKVATKDEAAVQEEKPEKKKKEKKKKNKDAPADQTEPVKKEDEKKDDGF